MATRRTVRIAENQQNQQNSRHQQNSQNHQNPQAQPNIPKDPSKCKFQKKAYAVCTLTFAVLLVLLLYTLFGDDAYHTYLNDIKSFGPWCYILAIVVLLFICVMQYYRLSRLNIDNNQEVLQFYLDYSTVVINATSFTVICIIVAFLFLESYYVYKTLDDN